MRNYVIRRVLLTIPTVFIVSLLIFFLIRLIPGSIVDAMAVSFMRRGQGGASIELNRAAIERALGLDVPMITQYGRWIGNIILHGDFGKSLWSKVPTINTIGIAWPITLELGFLGLIVAQIIALPIGVFSALRQDTWGDYIGRSFAILCIAVPGFWLATLVIFFPSIWWGVMPSVFFIPFIEDPIANLQMFIIPAMVLGMGMSGSTMRMTRTMMLEVLRQDYVRTAWAKGLRERVVIIRHALKNALIPVITGIGYSIPILFGGTVIIEQIFCLPGMGRLMLDALQQRDYPLVSAVMLVFGFGMVLTNLMVDLTYGFLDPRLHYK